MKTTLYKIFKNLDVTTLVEEDKEELLRFFNVTQDNNTRNFIAFIFSDIVYEPAVPFIFEKIHDKSILNNGSLVWALSPFNLEGYLLPIVKIAIAYDYEPRLMAYGLLKELVPKLSEAQKKEALEWALDYEAKMEPVLTDRKENSPWHFLQVTISLLENPEK